MSKELLGAYKNGNYGVMLFSDGTKVRYNKENYMRADRPESIDINISNRCENGCEFCYQGCTPGGAVADFTSPLFDSIPPYTEIALNGNGIFKGSDGFNPDLDDFLFRMARQHVICNITVHWEDFVRYRSTLRYWRDHGVIWGIGVSFNEAIDGEIPPYLYQLFQEYNVVIHVVAGVIPWDTINKLSDHHLKLLVLGYKNCGRGATYLKEHSLAENKEFERLRHGIEYLYQHFDAVSFDNLALEQLNIRATVSEETWTTSYMGEDGSATFFIDAVANTYARSSISERKPIDTMDVVELFRRVQNEYVS